MLDLVHKNVNRMFGFAIEQNNLTIIQEMVKLGTVYSKQDVIIFSENVIQKYVIQILDGLTFLFSNNLCHGDLTLKNLLLTAKGVVKLVDYGF
jgi:mitogen-activated protein kinase kinase kinase